MRLHDAVRYALYVSREIGGARASSFGAQRKITRKLSWAERDDRYILQNAALDVLTRILNFGFDGSSMLRDEKQLNLIGRGAVLSLIVRVMGGKQRQAEEVYGFTEGQKSARSTLADLIDRMWKYMRLVEKRDVDSQTDPEMKSGGLVDAVELLLRKFYVGAHLQKQLQNGGSEVIKPNVGEDKYAEKKLLWDKYITPLGIPHNETFDRLYAERMGAISAPNRRSKRDGATEPSTKRRSKRDGATEPLRVDTYDRLATIVFHDAFVISMASQRSHTVVLGKEAVDAIRATEVEMDEEAAVATFILNAIKTEGAKPLVVYCTSFTTDTEHEVRCYDFNDPGSVSDVGVFVHRQELAGKESNFITGLKYTHVALVVDASVVKSVPLAVAFWKTNKRGFNYAGRNEYDCAWVTVVIAQSEKAIPPSNSVVLGTVNIGALPVASVSCKGKRQYSRQALSVGGLRTYGGDLKVTNVVTIKLDATGLEKLALARCTETEIEAVIPGEEESRASNLPIAVIDVRGIDVTPENSAHFMALCTMRNYIMLTTQEQHDATASASDRPSVVKIPKKKGRAVVVDVVDYDETALFSKVAALRADAKKKNAYEADLRQLALESVARRAIQTAERANAERANDAPDNAAKATMGENSEMMAARKAQAGFESETVTILKRPVSYMTSGPCEMANRDDIQSAIRNRNTIAVTFLLVRGINDGQTERRHHGAVMRAKKIYGTLFYVECTASGAEHPVSFEMVTGGIGKKITVSETMSGSKLLQTNLVAVEEKYSMALKAWSKGKHDTRGKAPPKPHVYVLCQ